MTDRSRRPYRQANQLPLQVQTLIVRLKREHPSWGAPKIREKLRRLHSGLQIPALSTVHAVLDRHGLASCKRHDLIQPTTSHPLRFNGRYRRTYGPLEIKPKAVARQLLISLTALM